MSIEEARKQLPIYNIKNKLITEIQRNPCIIFLGETGCGKTTQITQFIYESMPTIKGMIACTQPRRVAAITVAMRVCEEKSCKLGSLVGYSVRFEDCTSSDTKIKYMTDGMLLRESISDSLLKNYSIIILDEIHERTVNTDILLGILKNAQAERKKIPSLKPLKIILMSATMDIDQYSKYFNNAPVFYLEGRQYPIEIFHSAEKQTDYLYSSIACVFQIHKQAPLDEDILLFLTGQEEIDSTCKTIMNLNKASGLNNLICLPFYSQLSSAKQLKVFDQFPENCRKVICSTNIAETSITIKRIKFVIDSGMIKTKYFNSDKNFELLKVTKISQAQAWQRSGRAGREQAGVCYRLYTEEEYDKMLVNTIPEILRTNLASVLLQIIAVGVKNLEKFDFIDKPSTESINTALEELILLDAIRKVNDAEYELTELGRVMVKFPLEPKLARCLIAAQKYNCVEDMIKILSLLSVDSVFSSFSKSKLSNEGGGDGDEDCLIRKKFVSSDGDHITLLNVYKAYIGSKSNKEWCHENHIDVKNMKLACDIRKQLREICVRENIQLNNVLSDTVSIRKALIHGFFMNTAEYFKETEFKTINSRQLVHIHPSSVLFHSKPMCLLFNELVQTSKTYMRDMIVINTDWLIEINPSYFKSKLKRSSELV